MMSYHSQEKVQILNLVYQLFYFHCCKKKNLAREGTFKNGLFQLTVISIVMRKSRGQKLEVSRISSNDLLVLSWLAPFYSF